MLIVHRPIEQYGPLYGRCAISFCFSFPQLITSQQIYDTKCLHYIDWLVETRPSFSPPRRDLRPPGMDPGANEVYTERLDALNTKFQRLLEQLSQRLKTAIEVSGADGLVSKNFFLSFCEKYSNWSILYRVRNRNQVTLIERMFSFNFLAFWIICNLHWIDTSLKWMNCRERYRGCPCRINRKLVFLESQHSK